MPAFAGILEDDADRVAQMRSCLADLLPTIDPIFFDNAQTMITWLTQHLPQVVLISLDHDLPIRHKLGRTIDCGTGRQVADFLASLPASCPVIIHSSNEMGASGMFFALKGAGWPCCRVYPTADLAWIRNDWAKCVRRCIQCTCRTFTKR